jgi:hypothetical protein
MFAYRLELKGDIRPFKHINGKFWENDTITILDLNEEWLRLCNVAKIEGGYFKYTIEKILDYMDRSLPFYNDLLKERGITGWDINSNDYAYRIETGTHFGIIYDYFVGELLKYDPHCKYKFHLRSNTELNENPEVVVLAENIFPNLSWKKETGKKPLGYKRDLAELLYTLEKSEMILKDNKPVNQKQIIEIFNKLLGTDMTEDSLYGNIGDRSFDNTFMSKLNNHLIEYSVKPLKKK